MEMLSFKQNPLYCHPLQGAILSHLLTTSDRELTPSGAIYVIGEAHLFSAPLSLPLTGPDCVS